MAYPISSLSCFDSARLLSSDSVRQTPRIGPLRNLSCGGGARDARPWRVMSQPARQTDTFMFLPLKLNSRIYPPEGPQIRNIAFKLPRRQNRFVSRVSREARISRIIYPWWTQVTKRRGRVSHVASRVLENSSRTGGSAQMACALAPLTFG